WLVVEHRLAGYQQWSPLADGRKRAYRQLHLEDVRIGLIFVCRPVHVTYRHLMRVTIEKGCGDWHGLAALLPQRGVLWHRQRGQRRQLLGGVGLPSDHGV